MMDIKEIVSVWGIGLIRLRTAIIRKPFVNAALKLQFPKYMELVR